MKAEIKVVHVLADGRRVDTIAGLTVPADNNAYDIIAKQKGGQLWQHSA